MKHTDASVFLRATILINKLQKASEGSLLTDYIRNVLLDAKAKQLEQLAELASKDRKPTEAKKFVAEAQAILHNLAELDEKLGIPDGPGGLDYREDGEIYISAVKFLNSIGRPVTEAELIEELIRGRHPGYRDERKMAIRVGRSVRSYRTGRGSENPKLKLKNGLIGLPDWPDKMLF